MIKNIDTLAERLKGIKVGDEELTVTTLTEKINSDEEFEIEVPDVNLFTDTELNELKETVGKASASKGAQTMIEMELKKKRDALGLEMEEKDIDSFVAALEDKFKKEYAKGNKKFEELQTDIDKLRNNYKEKEAELEARNLEFTNFKKTAELNSRKMKNIPEGLTGIKPEHFLAAASTDGITVDVTDEGVEYAIVNGQPVKDKLEKYVPIKDVFTEFAKNNNWLNGNGDGGAGDGDYKGKGNNSFKTMNDVYKYMEDNKIDPLSTEGTKLQDDFSEAQKSA